MEDRCVCCGKIIPEGRQVCWHCENSDTGISGIYILTRKDKQGIRYACIDQVLEVAGRHHINSVIREYGIYDGNNLYGWKGELKQYPPSRLSEYKSFFIKEYENYGYRIV